MSASGSDRNIAQDVTKRLAMRGIHSPCRIDVQSRNGEVTLTGSIQYPYQRSAAVQAASTTSGVRHVVDRMTVKPAVKRG
jgi:osmotically-inducible protein OsmY